VTDRYYFTQTAGSEHVLGDGALVLDDVHAHIERFVAFPTAHATVAATLWAAHCWVVDRFDSTPRIAFLSPEPGSGKSRALEVIGPMTPSPMHAVNATPAALFRSVSDLESRPTILFDEIDTVFGPKAKDNEEVRGFLNAGHRKGAVAYRCVGLGTAQKVIPFPAYCAVAIAGLNDVPDTIATRSIIIRMRRRAPGEHVDQYRFRHHDPEGQRLGEQLREWLASTSLAVDPPLPAGIVDRAADVWEPLLSIADAAGGHWPQRAREAAADLTARTATEPSLGVLLLHDLRVVFAGAEQLATEVILNELHAVDESPWHALGKMQKPLDARGLANMLRRYQVRSTNVRVGGIQAKGYRAEDLVDVWDRYLPTTAADLSVPSVPPSHDGQNRRSEALSAGTDGGTATDGGTDVSVPGSPSVPLSVPPETPSDLRKHSRWDAGTDGTDKSRPVVRKEIG
jgi:hypothetical protein